MPSFIELLTERLLEREEVDDLQWTESEHRYHVLLGGARCGYCSFDIIKDTKDYACVSSHSNDLLSYVELIDVFSLVIEGIKKGEYE